MKLYYILVVRVTLLSVFFFIASEALGQTMPPFTPYTRTKLYSWSDPYESYQYQRVDGANSGLQLRFRIKRPNGFDQSGPNDKFPLIVFLHGSGESGDSDPDLQDNEKQLVHGGQIHLNAVNNGTFPGFLLYPQMRKTPFTDGVRCEDPGDPICQNNWNPDWLESVRYVIDRLIASYKVDPNRIYIHGLSGGGGGAIRFMMMYPEYIAAANPMSAANESFLSFNDEYEKRYIHIPMRLSQGGNDGAPSPEDGNLMVNELRGLGGNVRYDYYPTNGHDTWNAEYNQPDFFSWFLSHKKNEIHVFYGQSAFCPGQSFSVRLGLSKTLYLDPPENRYENNYRIINYEWAKDNTSTVIASGASTNEITVTQPGTYYARFQRATGGWSEWSDGVTIDNSRGPSVSPVITANGRSTTLPALDGSGSVLLSGTTGKEGYQWRYNDSPVSGANLFNYTASLGGTYTLTSKDPATSPVQADGVTPTMYRALTQGCASLPSNEIVISTQSGIGSPAPPDNFFVASNALTSVSVNWDDRSDNETGYELYRSTNPSGGYQLVSILPATSAPNPQQYVDSGLEPNTTYYYRARAVNNTGGSAYTNVVSASSQVDNKAPSAPVLAVGSTSRTVINLFWSGATDNVGVVGYDVYQNGVQIASTTENTFAATNLIAQQSYYFTVRARDVAGNTSPSSNQVVAAAVNNGVFYKYYHHSGLTSTTEIETNGTLIKTGTISQFTLTPSTQSPGNRADNFAFVYEGFINIPSTGSWQFYTTSDDGSQLFIDDALLVNNDGAHGSTEKSGTLTLSAGSHAIKVTFFENGGGQALTVSWRGPGRSKQTIPASALSDTYNPPPALTNPSLLTATSASFEQINISWRDNANNESGFEVQRSTSSNGTYQVVHVAPAQGGTGGQVNWSDVGLSPTTTYYYKVRAISNTSASSLVGPASATTAAPPSTPAAPASLTATPFVNRVDLSWPDVSGETGYEIQKSANASTGFSTVETNVAGSTTFSDTQVSGHSQYYYRVRSLGAGGTASAWSPVASATTPNSAPVLVDIPNQTILQNSATPQTINLSVTDADLDAITFNITGLPNTNGVSHNGYGQGVISLTSVAPGTYNINVEASDGVDTDVDSFVLTVGNNQTPVVSALTVDGTAVTPTPIGAVPNQSAEAGRKFTMIFSVTDAGSDGNNLSAPLISNLPPFATANWTGTGTNAGTYTLTFNTTPSHVGIYENITITFRDDAGGLNVKSFAFIVVPFDPSYKVYVNLMGIADRSEGAPWNNLTVPSQTVTNLIDADGNTVKYVGLSASASWDRVQGSFNTTTFSNDPDAIFPTNVRNSFWGNTAGGGGLNNKVIRFTNLNPAIRYKVTLYGAVPSQGLVQAVGPTEFTVNGNSLPDLTTVDNLNDVRTSSDLLPNSNGELVIELSGPSGNPNYILNAIILEATYIATTPPDAPSSLAATAPLNNKVDLTWIDNSLNETGFNIYRATSAEGPFTTPIGSVGPNVKAYSDNTTEGRTTYYYRVTAVNGYGSSAPSNTVIITTPNGIPSLSAIPLTTVSTGGNVQVSLSATDPDGDPIVLSGLNLPAFANLSDNHDGTGSITFTPGSTDAGLYTVTVRATDNSSASAEREFTLIVSDSEYQHTVYVNFVADNSSNENAPWNNVIPTGMNGLLNSVGGNSGINIARSGSWVTTSNSVGVNTGNNSGEFPDRVLQSAWVTAQTSNNGSTITLSNLNTSRRYNITIVGSRNEFWFANTIYRVGSTDKVLNTSKNKSNYVKFSGLEPNSSSNITLVVKKDGTSWSDGGSPIGHRDGVISGILIEVYNPGSKPVSPKNLTAKGTAKDKILLTWEDNSSNETAFHVERAENPSGPFTVRASNVTTPTTGGIVTWEDTGLLQNKAYVYRVRAVNSGNFSEYTNTATASTWDQVILLNITPNAGSTGEAPAPWNNATAGDPQAGTKYSNLTDENNIATKVDVEFLSSGNGGILGVLDGGYVPASQSGIYPLQVYKNYVYFLPFMEPAELKVGQVDPRKAYDLKFFSNEWNFTQVGANLTTDFGYNGTFKSLFNGRNITETVSFDQITPERGDSAIYFQIISNPEALAAVWSALEIHSYTPIDVAFDTQAPSVPANIQASSITGGSLNLTWTASSDNVGVWEYQIYKDDVFEMAVTSNAASITGLSPTTTYNFTVRAVDAKDNMSNFSTPLQVLTGAGVMYYWTQVPPITNPANWNTDEDGTGTAATSFDDVDQYFVLTGNATIDDEFAISGTNTKLIVNSGVEYTITTERDLVFNQLEIANGSSLSITAGQVGSASITLGNENGGGLLIQDGCTLTLGENELVLQGDGAINPGNETGQISVNGGTLTIQTTTSTRGSNLYFHPANNMVGTLSVNTSETSPVNLRSRVGVRDVVTMIDGTLNSNGNLVLLSNETSTARVAPIQNSGTIEGNVEFQRYLNPKGQRYRYLGTPVSGTTVEDWQQYIPITGTFTNASPQSSAPSMFYYDEEATVPGWQAYPTTSNQATLEIGRGYSIYDWNGNAAKVLQLTGPLYQGDFNFDDLLPAGASEDPNDGWTLLANPYASPIKWAESGWTKSGINGTVSVRDNNSGGDRFVTSNEAGVGDAEFLGVIAQGQSFWVKSTNGSPSLTVSENGKHDASAAVIFKQAAPTNVLTFTLAKGAQIDRAFIHFSEGYSNEPLDRQDGVNRPNSYFDVTSVANGIDLAINSLPLDFCETTIPLNLSRTPAGTYTLDASSIESFTFDAEIKLVDHFTAKTIDLKEVPRYTFSVTSDARSFGASRMEVVVAKPQILDGLEFTTVDQVCAPEGSTVITVTNTQRGANYQVMSGSDVITSFTGQGGTMEFLMPLDRVKEGLNTFATTAAFSGCAGIVLTHPIELTLSTPTTPVIDDITVCAGDDVTLSVNQPAPDRTYRWFESGDSSAPLAENATGQLAVGPMFKTQSYYVSQLQGNCESNRVAINIKVNQLDIPEITVASTRLESSSASGNQWLLNGIEISGATGNIFTPEEAGSYSVRVDNGMCQTTSAPVAFLVTGVEGDINKQLNVHPNPARSAIYITMPPYVLLGQPVGVAIYSAQGHIMKEFTGYNSSEGITVNVEDMSSGYYLISVNINGQRVIRKFVKE